MAMETDIVRSDNEKVFEELKRLLLSLFKSLAYKIYNSLSPRAKRVIKSAIDKTYRNRVARKSRVLKDGATKEVCRIKGLSVEETYQVLDKCEQAGILDKVWLEGYNYNAEEFKRKTVVEIHKYKKVYDDLKQAKEEYENNPDNAKLRKKFEKCQQAYDTKVKQMNDGFDEEKYNSLVKEVKASKENVNYKLTPEEKADCYDKACSHEPLQNTIVYNISRSAFFEKIIAEIEEQRAINRVMTGEEIINDKLNPEKSKAIIELQSKEMFYDKEMYQQKYEKAVALHSNDYKPSITEELAMKKECLYRTVTYSAFVDNAKKENKEYIIYECPEEQAEQICKDLNKNGSCSNFYCAYTEDKKNVDIYIYEEDNNILKDTINAPIKKRVNLSDKETSKSTLDVSDVTRTYPLDNIDDICQKLKDSNIDYEVNYKRTVDNKSYAEVIAKNVSVDETRQLFDREKSIDAPREEYNKIQEKKRERLKDDVLSKQRNKWTVSNAIKDLRNQVENSTTNCKPTEEFLSKYDEMTAFNGGKDMSEEDYKKFNDAYWSNYSSKQAELEKFKTDYQNKMAGQNINKSNSVENDKTVEPSANINKDNLDDNVINVDIEIGEE